MVKIKFSDLSGPLKFAAIGAIIHSFFAMIAAFLVFLGLVMGIFY